MSPHSPEPSAPLAEWSGASRAVSGPGTHPGPISGKREQSELNPVDLHDSEKPPAGDAHLPWVVVSLSWKINPIAIKLRGRFIQRHGKSLKKLEPFEDVFKFPTPVSFVC